MTVFEAIAEPNRRAMLDYLADGERTVNDLVAAFPTLSQPGVSRHLKVLRDVRLVDVRPVAQQRFYFVRPEGLSEIDAWLSRYRKFWNGKLDALEEHLARQHGRENQP